MSHPAPLWMCQNLWRCPQSAYSTAIQKHTLKTLEHMYMHSATHKCRYSHTVSLLPCVSSYALSHSPCEEGPNFSLISFIKRCGEKERKRRRGEGRREKKEAGGSDRWVMNRVLHSGLHHLGNKRGV